MASRAPDAAAPAAPAAEPSAPAQAEGTDPSAAPAPAEAASETSAPSGDAALPEEVESDPERKAEAASYTKLVSTFIRTDFDSTRKRVARRLQAARNSEDEVTRQLVEAAINRLREEGQYDSFESALGDAASATG
jgi:hypothetical protein